jgi:hypothetical protein
MEIPDLDLQFAAARLLEAGTAAEELLRPCKVSLRTMQHAETITLVVDNREVATFGPGHPVECADALYSFITHLTTRIIAEA